MRISLDQGPVADPADLAVGPVRAEPGVDLVQPRDDVVEEAVRHGAGAQVERDDRAHHGLDVGATAGRCLAGLADRPDCSGLHVQARAWSSADCSDRA